MAINSMALRRGKRPNMKPDNKHAQINPTPIVSAKGMEKVNLNKELGLQSSVSMPACHRVKP